ncbi:MAG: ABC transporter permease [Bacilli bacterium]|nr:ABC transporter permease [Bacilli bacterium]
MKNKHLKNLFVALVFFFLYLPIIILIVFSFNTSKMNIIFEGFTFKWYNTLLHNRDLLEAFINTMIIAITSTVISTIIGTIGAVGLNKHNFPGKNLINKLIYIPIVIPEIVLGISLLSMYTLLKLELGMFTLILSHIAFSIPYVIVSVRSTLSPLIKTYEEAAADLGANEFTTFLKITLPSIMPGVISGATLAFTLSMDDVVISYFTAGPGSNTLPLKIYSIIKTGITPDVNALSTLMLLVTIIILTASAINQSRKIAAGEVR